MCSNCNALQACDCTGGAEFATCLCEQGEFCSACEHQPNTEVESKVDFVAATSSEEFEVEPE